jgi:hypothetical protein
MAKVGGARAGAGRPRGSVSRQSIDAVAKAMADGISPVEYMLNIMRNDDADAKERAWAAEKVAPFVHPRPAPMERTVEIDLPDTSTIAGVDQALDRIIAAMASGTVSPSEGQSFISAIETRRKAIETGDLLARIEALEGQRK